MKEKNKYSLRPIFVIWTSVVVNSSIHVVVVDACRRVIVVVVVVNEGADTC